MKRYLDGYNLLFHLNISPNSIEEARNILIERFSSHPLTIVFDGQDFVRTHVKRLEIIYTDKNQSADDYILSEIEHNLPCTVITSDRDLSIRARHRGATVQTLDSLTPPTSSLPQEPAFSPAEFDRWLEIFEKNLEE